MEFLISVIFIFVSSMCISWNFINSMVEYKRQEYVSAICYFGCALFCFSGWIAILIGIMSK